MTRLCQPIFCLAAATVVFGVQAQNPSLPPAKASAVAINLMPPTPPAGSPVTLFRNLLAMSPQERVDYLTNRPPEFRARILVKVHEYEILDPDERELRLCATELRWYLMPLLQTGTMNRNEELARVPDNLRDIVKSRLTQWDILPPPLKQEFLENDRALHYFTRVEAPGNPAADDAADRQRQKIAGQFNQFFELTPAEKQITLNTLSAPEQVQMKKTLQSFEELPPQQRAECVRNYVKFAGMSAAERAQFLKNAERWSQMSPAERQAWRDLVAHVPQWPPLPQSLMPPMPPIPSKNPHQNIATN
jgi:Protein of unknown function (DUF3106)